MQGKLGLLVGWAGPRRRRGWHSLLLVPCWCSLLSRGGGGSSSSSSSSSMAAAAAARQGQPPLRGAVLFLHGSGSSGRDLAWMLRASKFEDELRDMGLKLVCPTAAPRPYTFAGRAPSTVWFDRVDLHPDAPEDATGADASYDMLRGILDQLQREHGIGSRSVYVGGFSMGGGMALQFLARHPEPLGGVFGFGSFLATDSSVYGQLGASAAATPILLGHGQHDSAVHYDWGLATARRLHRRLGELSPTSSRVAFFGFPHLDHELDQRELTVLSSWLRAGGAAYPDVGPLKERFARQGGVVRETLGAPVVVQQHAELAMTVTEEEGSEGSVTVVFHDIPAAAMPALLAHPIAVHGAHFALVQGPKAGTVQTTFVSPRPRDVAEALRDRVRARLQDPDGGRRGAEGVCPVS